MAAPLSDMATAASARKSKRTRLDRTVRVLLDHPDRTPSRRLGGIDAYTERLHRLHGTSVIRESCAGLSLGPSTFATACTLLHRFYHSASLSDHDVWSASMACTLLATKVEDEPKSLGQIVEEYARIYSRRLVLAGLDGGDEEKETGSGNTDNHNSDNDNDNDNNHNNPKTREIETTRLVRSSPRVACLKGPIETWKTASERRDVCATRLPMRLNKFGPVYKEWHERVTEMESIVLRTLGFTFYWISDSHPHRFLLDFCGVLEVNDAQFTQRAWNYCNDSCRLDLSVRYLPEVIASSAILLAARDFDTALPTTPRPWWQVFIGSDAHKGQELVDVANAILGLCELRWGIEGDDKKNDNSKNKNKNNSLRALRVDWLAASRGFLRSLVQKNGTETAFNDPDSFLWFHQNETFEKEMQNVSSSSSSS